MAGRSWQASDAKSLLDEAPQAYKPIDVVMRDQADLVEIEVELSSIATTRASNGGEDGCPPDARSGCGILES
jgi:tRNA-splicing ligase RtcB